MLIAADWQLALPNPERLCKSWKHAGYGDAYRIPASPIRRMGGRTRRVSRRQVRASRLAVFRLMLMAGSAVLVATAIAACGGHVTVTVNGGPVAPNPVTFRPAKLGPDGSITGTYFRATLPAGWVDGAAFFASNPNVEVAIKKGPTTATGPGIIVTLTQAPADLPLAPYADISFHQWIADKTAGKIHLITGLKSASVAGEEAEDFTISSSGNTAWTIYVLYKGVAYDFQLAAPTGQFAAARSGPFRAFLASWQWR